MTSSPTPAVLPDARARALHNRWAAACARHTELLRTHADVTHPAVKRSGQRCAALYSDLSAAAIEALVATPPASDAAAILPVARKLIADVFRSWDMKRQADAYEAGSYDETLPMQALVARLSLPASDATDVLPNARALSRQLAYAFCGKLKHSQKADVSERLGIKLDYSLTALERDKRFLRAVVDAGAVGILQAAVSSFLPDEFATPPASDAAVSAGFVLVPVEPSEAMREAGEIASWDDGNHMPAINLVRSVWDAMLAAAPKVASDTP